VVNAAHALAERGHSVTLCLRAAPGPRPSAVEILDFYGLTPTHGLTLRVLRSSGTLASAGFRAAFAAWVAANPGGIAIARSKRYAIEAKRWFGARFHLVLEAHEVDSRQAGERGDDPAAFRSLEVRALAVSEAVIANCPGTLDLLRETHAFDLPATALHNATHANRVRHPTDAGEDLGYVGSALAVKDLETVAAAASRLDRKVVLVGPSAEAVEALQPLSGGRLVREEPLPHRLVPDRLARFRTLVLPLGSGLFGDRLTSPLKLFDYLASGRPIAAADTPAVRSAAPAGSFVPWKPGDPASLADALDRLDRDENLRRQTIEAAIVRTWADRAAETEQFVDQVFG
jgi:glycosyltransferase involved in cell wall biosynthesis